MKKSIISALTLTICLGFAPQAIADENAALCHLYSATGAGTVEFLLPLTVQQYVNLTAGKDKALADQMTQAIVRQYNPQIIAQLQNTSPEKIGLMGEAAGQTVTQLLMSGQATSKADVQGVMTSACQALGANTIIEEQKKLRESLQQQAAQQGPQTVTSSGESR